MNDWNNEEQDSEFETNLKERCCAKWTVILVNFILFVIGIATVVVAAIALTNELPLGSWPKVFLFQGIIIMCVGIFGICSTKKSCLATLYFVFMVLMTVFIAWAVAYLLANKSQIDGMVETKVMSNWNNLYKTLPSQITAKFKEFPDHCKLMNNTACWETLKQDYYEPKKKAFRILAILQLLLVPTVMICSARLIGANMAVNSISTMMDAIMLVAGVTIIIFGIHTYSLGVPTAKAVSIIAVIIGGVMTALATICGNFCDKIYDKCCKSCNTAWMLSAMVYSLIAIVLLVIGALMLSSRTDSEVLAKVRGWSNTTLNSMCDETCMKQVMAGTQEALQNHHCNTTNIIGANSTIHAIRKPCTKSPSTCYKLAIMACDASSASQYAVNLIFQDSMQNAGWAFFLGFGYVLVQIFCKVYKWKFEDSDDNNSIGYVGLPIQGV